MITGNECAYPTQNEGDPGLTIRQRFAESAMKGILSASADRGESAVAKMAVKFADALIDELNRTTK